MMKTFSPLRYTKGSLSLTSQCFTDIVIFLRILILCCASLDHSAAFVALTPLRMTLGVLWKSFIRLAVIHIIHNFLCMNHTRNSQSYRDVIARDNSRLAASQSHGFHRWFPNTLPIFNHIIRLFVQNYFSLSLTENIRIGNFWINPFVCYSYNKCAIYANSKRLFRKYLEILNNYSDSPIYNLVKFFCENRTKTKHWRLRFRKNKLTFKTHNFVSSLKIGSWKSCCFYKIFRCNGKNISVKPRNRLWSACFRGETLTRVISKALEIKTSLVGDVAPSAFMERSRRCRCPVVVSSLLDGLTALKQLNWEPRFSATHGRPNPENPKVQRRIWLS